MKQPIKAVLFDLDGTIIDSIDGIVASFEHALAQHAPGHGLTRKQLIMTIGEPLPVQMLAFARGDQALANTLVATYRQHNQSLIAGFPLYPDVHATLAGLRRRGFRLGLVTSKYRQSAMISIDAHGLGSAFELLMTADDTIKHKPDPMPLLVAAERLGLKPGEIIYVGDSVHDIRCANGAGCLAAAALWGPFERTDLAALQPRYLVERFSDLTALDLLTA